jgi:ATP/maltotriose-dependent transcriptional regulator MalT
VLCNGLGAYDEACAAAVRATESPPKVSVLYCALPELIEAATRSGHTARATEALDNLALRAQASGTSWALGLEARSRALLSDDEAAGEHYRSAIEHLGRTRARADLARAHLLHGEWLRRVSRRAEAKHELSTALEMLSAMGMEGFAGRARQELTAIGAPARKGSPATRGELTPQETQIARLARDGLSNPEIGAQLFLSARTIEWHLRKVFTKLRISSRRQLRGTQLP